MHVMYALRRRFFCQAQLTLPTQTSLCWIEGGDHTLARWGRCRDVKHTRERKKEKEKGKGKGKTKRMQKISPRRLTTKASIYIPRQVLPALGACVSSLRTYARYRILPCSRSPPAKPDELYNRRGIVGRLQKNRPTNRSYTISHTLFYDQVSLMRAPHSSNVGFYRVLYCETSSES